MSNIPTQDEIEAQMLTQIEARAKARAAELLEQKLTEQRKGKPLVAKPEMFDGEKSKYRDWLRQIKTYLRYVEGGRNEKIDIVLSYIKGPKVDTWTTNLFEDFFDEGWALTMNQLWQKLDEQFVEAGAQRQAQAKLENLRQTGTAEEFFQEFEKLCRQANYLWRVSMRSGS